MPTSSVNTIKRFILQNILLNPNFRTFVIKEGVHCLTRVYKTFTRKHVCVEPTNGLDYNVKVEDNDGKRELGHSLCH